MRATEHAPLARWRKNLFIMLHRNAPAMQVFFQLPLRQVLELSSPVEL